jgi:hypothetical protein
MATTINQAMIGIRNFIIRITMAIMTAIAIMPITAVPTVPVIPKYTHLVFIIQMDFKENIHKILVGK